MSDDFWSTSTCELDNSTIQSQRSLSSVTTLNQILFHGNGTGNTGGDTEFVNHGLLLWNEIRHNWVGASRTETHNRRKQELKLNWNATYESLLGSRQRFPKPIPLSEMVEFLVDIWEQEGMYD